MRPKARGLVQHGGPPGLLEDSDPTKCNFVHDGRSMPPSLTDQTTCPGLGLICYRKMGLIRTPKKFQSNFKIILRWIFAGFFAEIMVPKILLPVSRPKR
jgi:hypothetical protein